MMEGRQDTTPPKVTASRRGDGYNIAQSVIERVRLQRKKVPSHIVIIFEKDIAVP